MTSATILITTLSAHMSQMIHAARITGLQTPKTKTEAATRVRNHLLAAVINQQDPLTSPTKPAQKPNACKARKHRNLPKARKRAKAIAKARTPKKRKFPNSVIFMDMAWA